MRSGQFKIKSSGFTIVELLVVIVVIGILAAITIVSYTGISQKATIASIQSDLNNASNIFKLDQVTGSAYPADLASANGNKGIASCTGNTTCFYAVNNSLTPQGFCLDVTKNLITYRITNDSSPTLGDCKSYGLQLSLDAGNTLSYSVGSTAWNDLSGNGNHGTLINSVGYSVSGGGSLTFNGSNQDITVANSSSLTFGNGTTDKPFTISCWVNFAATATTAGVISKASTATTGEYYIIVSSGQIYFRLVDKGQVNYLGVVTVPVYNTSTWYHVVAVYNGNSQNSGQNIYVNGAVVATNTNNSGTYTSMTNQAVPLYIGYRGAYLSCSIADTKVYNRELPSAEILLNFNSTKARYGL